MWYDFSRKSCKKRLLFCDVVNFFFFFFVSEYEKAITQIGKKTAMQGEKAKVSMQG